MRLTTNKPNGFPTGRVAPVHDEYGGVVDAMPTYYTRYARKRAKLTAPRLAWKMTFRDERLKQNRGPRRNGKIVRPRKDVQDPLERGHANSVGVFKEMGFNFLPGKRTEVRTVKLP